MLLDFYVKVYSYPLCRITSMTEKERVAYEEEIAEIVS